MSVESVKAWLSAELAKLEGNTVIKTIETDAKAIGSATLSYIEANGLQDVYKLALAVITSLSPEAPWASIVAGITTQLPTIITDGKAIEAGAVNIVANMAKADILAAAGTPAS